MKKILYLFFFAFLFVHLDLYADDRNDILSLYVNDAKPDGDLLLKKLRANPQHWSSLFLKLSQTQGLPDRFYIDVARAFIYAGDSFEQIDVASQLLSKASFKLLDKSEWLYLCQKIAQREADAMPCARRLLDEPTFYIGLLGGDDGVGKDYALVFLLLQMPEQKWNREIGDRLWRGVDNPSSQIAMLSAMFYAVSLRDDAILVKFADDSTRNELVRRRATLLLTQMSSMEKNASVSQILALRNSLKISKNASEEELRSLRREALHQVSRDALLNLERYTFLIRAEAVSRWKERLRKLD